MLPEPEQERFLKLWAESQPAVVQYIHATVRDVTAAKDLAQETALVLFRRFAEYDGRRPFLAWALGVARFMVRGFHRDAARSRVWFDTELLDDFTERWAEAATVAPDRSAELEDCIERLPEGPRQLVQLRYFDQLTSMEIATRIGTSGAAVRMALQRIRDQLRNCIEQRLRFARHLP